MRVILTALAAACVTVVLDGSQGVSSERFIRLRFSDRADLQGLSIHYFLTGPFGGYGNFVGVELGRREYSLETSHQGQQATTLKAIVFCPGYRIVLLRELLAAHAVRTIPIEFEPLGRVPLPGRLVSVKPSNALRIEAVYSAYWGHEFFGISDGAVPSFIVASSALNADGSFALSVPDLARDPVVTSFNDGLLRGVLRLVVRETGTGNMPFRLELADRAGQDAELQLASTYPQELMLMAIPRR